MIEWTGITFWPTTGGRWQVSTRTPGVNGDSWNVNHYDTLELALERTNEMAGKRGARKSVNETASQLLEALKFTSVGYKATGDVMATHTMMMGGWCVSYDGVIEAGMPIALADFDAFPDTKLLADALNNVGKEIEITSLDEGVYIKSGDFEVTIPSGDRNLITAVPPDQNLWPLNNDFKIAVVMAGKIVKDTAEKFRDATIWQNNWSMVATNGVCLVEVLHKNNVPPGVVFPKAFANALNKTEKNIVGFGYTEGVSFTVWYEDGSFIRTNLYNEPYPIGYDKVTELMSAEMFLPFPTGMVEGIAAVAPFGTAHRADGKNVVAFRGGYVVADPFFTSSGLLEWNANKAVKALPDSPRFDAQWFNLYSGDTTDIGFATDVQGSAAGRVVLRGDLCRVAIAGVGEPKQQSDMSPYTPAEMSGNDDDIPF